MGPNLEIVTPRILNTETSWIMDGSIDGDSSYRDRENDCER